MSIYAEKKSLVWNTPSSCLGLEDMIALMGKLQELQYKEKQYSLSLYTSPDYGQTIKKFLEICNMELDAQKAFYRENMTNESF